MIAALAVAALNHLLGQENWARERLRPFAGQGARLAVGPTRLTLTITGEGLFTQARDSLTPAVEISLPADTPLRYLSDPPSVFAAARLTGSVDFAEAIGFVFRNLHWDAEGDLAKIVGDIAAHRLSVVGRNFLGWQKRAAGNLVANLAEYAAEPGGPAVSRPEVQAFCSAVSQARDDLARLEKRLAKL